MVERRAPLDSRVVRIVRWLLDQEKPRSTSDLAANLVLSERAVRYRLSAVQNFLASHGADLVRRRGSGLEIVADDDARKTINEDLEARVSPPRVYTPDERGHLLLDTLLWAYPETTSLERLNEDLEVSKTSARRDLRRSEPWLDRMNLPVLRKPGHGIALDASEHQVRRGLVQLLLEAVPGDVLEELTTGPVDDASLLRIRVPLGLRERLESLAVYECAEAIRSSPLRDDLALGNSELCFTLHLAISESRLRDEHPIDLEPDVVLSRMEHPISDLARQLTDTLCEVKGCSPFPDEEVADLVDRLLGFQALLSATSSDSDTDRLVTEMLAIATARLDVDLTNDDELRESLTLHLLRVDVRVRHRLPVHNPLVEELAERYPKVHAVAGDLAVAVDEHLGTEISEAEIGFLTMYLAGAVEREESRSSKRAMVVCPDGQPTAWVLVSRLQAEFPEIAFADVQSASSDDNDHYDLVISTAPLVMDDVKVVVVTPLLSASDVETVREAL